MADKKRDTIGKIASDLMQKEGPTRDPIALEREMQKEYLDELFEVIEKDKGFYPTDFYVVVLTKKERLMSNVIRNYFFTRITCPTPDYDQAVYKYYQKEEALEFLWVIPSRDTCSLLKENAINVEEKELLQYVLDFADGSLFKLCKQLNGEELESPLLEKE